MAVFRVKRNKELALKEKGLLSQMLLLLEGWDYTIAGLSLINWNDICETVRELERTWYIVRLLECD